MSQIFNSHSQRDEGIKSFFYRAFSGTSVLPIWQEYEERPSRPVDEEIERKIQASSALFVLLSEKVEGLPHTRDWILWECGKATDKDIWVFEPYESLGRVTVAIPRFKHYVRYHKNQEWRGYINSIIRSYDNSSLLGWAGAGAGIGAAVSPDDRGGGALLGSIVGAIVESVVRPAAPTGSSSAPPRTASSPSRTRSTVSTGWSPGCRCSTSSATRPGPRRSARSRRASA